MPPDPSKLPEVYLRDMIDSATHAIDYLGDRSLEEFASNELVQDAIIRRIEIIGEAAKRVAPEHRPTIPDLDWSDICGMRDILIHQYGAIDVGIVFETVKQDLPNLIASITAHLDQFGKPEQDGPHPT